MMLVKIKNYFKLGLLLIFLGLFLFTLFSHQALTDSSDAIAIRVIPNPHSYSPLRWYKENIKNQGAPQSLTVDGYEAVRDGRTVYVNAANISNDTLYTNIYLISFNQEAQSQTEDIFGQILMHWKFNNNLTTTGQCNKTIEQVCQTDADCPKDEYCLSLKAKVIRDTKRMADLKEIKFVLDDYKNNKYGHYPKLESGTYLPQKTISTWPSWQESLAKELGITLAVDPLNKLDGCSGSYNETTCWDEKSKFMKTENYNHIFGSNPTPYDNAFVYQVLTKDGSNYKLCSFMESGLVLESAGNCNESSVSNNPPQIQCGLLKTYISEPLTGYLNATDPEGHKITQWGINTLGNKSVTLNGWSKPIELKNTAQENSKMIYSTAAPSAPGSYNITILAADEFNMVGQAQCTINILDKNANLCVDSDNDGYDNCSPGQAGDDGKQLDPNDANNTIYPGATEICGNGIDEDCNGSDLICPQTCTPNGCNNNCPAGCTPAQDPDCGTTGCCGDGTCQGGENHTNCSADCPENYIIKAVTPANGESFNQGDAIWFNVLIEGGKPLYDYNWNSSIDGDFHSVENRSETWESFSISTLSLGLHTIKVEIIDSEGNKISETFQIQINTHSVIQCFSFADCDDHDPCSQDICNNPGETSSFCSHNAVTICQDNDGCCPTGCSNVNDNECPVAVANDDPAKILLVYNNKCATDANKNGVKDSYELALYYQQKRQLPDSNLLGVSPSVGGGGCNYYYYQASSYPIFYTDIVVPIQNKIAALGGHNIYYILLEGLVPYSLTVNSSSTAGRSLDNALMTLYDIPTASSYPEYYAIDNPYRENSPTKSPDVGHFSHSFMYKGGDIFLVSRIHQPALIDRALYGEKYIYNEAGYYSGLGYVDTRFAQYTDQYLQDNYPSFSDVTYGGYGWADRLMAYGKIIFDNINWNYKWETTEKEIGETGAKFFDGSDALIAPDALWYEGWYNFGAYHDVFNWKPGAVACDLNSNSGVYFLQKAFSAGLTAGTGVTGEPYTTGHPRPEVFIHYILNGYNFAEASALSYPATKWRDIAYGDPIYNPNKIKTKLKDITLPQISQIFSATNLTNSATSSDITVRLNINSQEPEVAMFRLEYGQDTNYGNTVDYNYIYTTEKIFSLTNLSPNTVYHYKIYAVDPTGNISSGSDKTFKTSPSQSTLPASLSVTASQNIGASPLAVNFTATPGEAPLSYEWNFNDGQTSNLQNPSHTFNKGFYKVILVTTFANSLTRVAELLIVAK